MRGQITTAHPGSSLKPNCPRCRNDTFSPQRGKDLARGSSPLLVCQSIFQKSARRCSSSRSRARCCRCRKRDRHYRRRCSGCQSAATHKTHQRMRSQSLPGLLRDFFYQGTCVPSSMRLLTQPPEIHPCSRLRKAARRRSRTRPRARCCRRRKRDRQYRRRSSGCQSAATQKTHLSR